MTAVWIPKYTEWTPILAPRWIKLHGKPGGLAYAPVPILVLTLASAFLWGSSAPHPLGQLQDALHLLFTFMAPLCAVLLVKRRFQALGEPGMLMLGGAAALWSFTALLNSFVVGNINAMVSVHNIGAWCASLFHLVGVILEQRRAPPLRKRSWWFSGMLLIALGLTLLIMIGARTGFLPVLFIQGHGGTPVRQFVLGLAIGTYLLTAAILMLPARSRKREHAPWYGLFLTLFALGLFGTLIQRSAGSVLGWTGRAAQYLSALYLLRAAWAASQERFTESISLQKAFGNQTLRYIVALFAVLISTAFRLVFLGMLGSGLDFLTYFPAVTISALYGGLWAGIASTLLSSLLTALLFMRPAGEWDLPLHVTGISIGVFLVSGFLVSFAVENMHRARARAAAAEATAAAALERERAAKTLRHTVDELQRSNRELEQFAYVASHDLQEPLRMVLVFLGLLDDSCRDRLEGKEPLYLDSALGGARRMRILIHDLLAYSRLEAQAREAAPVSLQASLELAMENLGESIRESGARITQDPLPVVLGNGPQLAQVLQNLLGNAIKFRSAEPAIHVSARRQGSHWLCSIKDNGIGLDPRYGQRIFEIFQRLHTKDQHPGTGIGLAICRKIVECHGGKIWVESTPGQGATFHFTLRAA